MTNTTKIRNDLWWKNLSQKDREEAFYAVTKRIFQGVICDQMAYDEILQEVFGIDGKSDVGRESGYYAIHNALTYK